MGRMLGMFAAAGVQIVVETHSDHVLNGARIAVRDKSILPHQVALNFFKGSSDDGDGLISIGIDGNGALSEWPDGFFDQAEHDLMALSGAN